MSVNTFRPEACQIKIENGDNRDVGTEHTTESVEHLTKVSIRLEGPAGYELETVWAEAITDGLDRLRNVPFLAYGYSEQDVVSAAEVGGRLIVNGVAERGGHSTYRVFLPEPTSEEYFHLLWKPFASLGCTYEPANRRLIGIDVPPASDVYAVYAVLEQGEASKQWDFEEGHCGHLLRK
jgi:hypothetical protein